MRKQRIGSVGTMYMTHGYGEWHAKSETWRMPNFKKADKSETNKSEMFTKEIGKNQKTKIESKREKM